MAAATIADLLTMAKGQQLLPFLKNSRTSQGQGNFQSLWQSAGYPATGNTPATGSGEAPTSSTTGAFAFTNPGAGLTAYLTLLQLTSSASHSRFVLYDRLIATSGLSGLVTTAQTVNSVALTRNTGGTGNELWLDWYTATGINAETVTASYTNEAGTSGRTTQTATIPASAVAGFSLYLPLQSGDQGVRSVQSVTIGLSTGTAGNFGVTIRQRIATAGMVGQIVRRSLAALSLGLPQIAASACLEFLQWADGASTSNLGGALAIGQV